jgi:hypothetical protein
MAKKNNKKSNKWWMIVVAFIVGVIVLFLFNNFTTQEVYEGVSCTYNQNSCDYPAWDGQCTDDVSDKCCTSIRTCEGIVANPRDCLDKYCYAEGNTCDAVLRIDGQYECKCIDIYEQMNILSWL